MKGRNPNFDLRNDMENQNPNFTILIKFFYSQFYIKLNIQERSRKPTKQKPTKHRRKVLLSTKTEKSLDDGFSHQLVVLMLLLFFAF